MSDATRRERAEQVIRDIHKELPDVWLGGRQRYVLVEAIANALADAERRGMERAAGIAEEFSQPYDIDWWFKSTKKEVSAQICRDVAFRIRMKAQAEKEAPHGTDAE